MTLEQAWKELRRPSWPPTLDACLAHPTWGKLLRARVTVARRKNDRNGFDWKRAQSNDVDSPVNYKYTPAHDLFTPRPPSPNRSTDSRRTVPRREVQGRIPFGVSL